MTVPEFSQSVQDLSNSPHGMVSAMEAPNLLSAWTEPSSYHNPPVLSPIQLNPANSLFLHESPPDLSPVCENPSSSPLRQQIPPNLSSPQQNPPFFFLLFPLPSLVCRGFVQTFLSLHTVQTHSQDSCLSWLHLLYSWERMLKLNYVLLLIGILHDY